MRWSWKKYTRKFSCFLKIFYSSSLRMCVHRSLQMYACMFAKIGCFSEKQVLGQVFALLETWEHLPSFLSQKFPHYTKWSPYISLIGSFLRLTSNLILLKWSPYSTLSWREINKEESSLFLKRTLSKNVQIIIRSENTLRSIKVESSKIIYFKKLVEKSLN